MQHKIKPSYISKLGFQETLEVKAEIRKQLKNMLIEDFKLIELEPAIVTDTILWLNDDFNMSERPIDFDTTIEIFGQVIQSNAKWRRKTISNFENKTTNTGILTDGLYPRRDRIVSNVQAIAFNEIGFDVLKEKTDIEDVKLALTTCYANLLKLDTMITSERKELNKEHLNVELTYVTSRQLKTLYPLLSLADRINSFGRDQGSFVFFDFIKSRLESKRDAIYSQDVYEFDTYCELYVFNRTIQQTIRVGWGAYQVGRDQLKTQTQIMREDWKGKTQYENLIKQNNLDLTMSISLDFAVITMLLLEKQHIAEVIASVWEPEFLDYINKNKIKIM